MTTFSTVADIEAYINETEDWVNGVLDTLQWTPESVIQGEDYIVCSESTNHFVSVDKLDQHVEYCEAARKGYSKSDLSTDKSSDFFYEKATKVVPIKLSEEMLLGIIASIRGHCGTEVIPKSMDRYLSDLTPGERLKIYEYCIESAKAAHSLRVSEEDLMLLSETKRRDAPPQEKSRLEILAEERDQRRRRQSYKGKKVHSGKKSHLEVMKEVIDNQMEILQQMWEEDKAADERLNQKKEDKYSDNDRRQDSRDSRHSYSRNRDRNRDNYSSRGRSSSQDRDYYSRRIRRDHRKRSRDTDSYRGRSRDRDSNRDNRSRDRDSFRDRKRDDRYDKRRDRDEKPRDRDRYTKANDGIDKTLVAQSDPVIAVAETSNSNSTRKDDDQSSKDVVRSRTNSKSRSRTKSRSKSKSRSRSRSKSRRSKKKKRKSDRSEHKKKKKHKSKD